MQDDLIEFPVYVLMKDCGEVTAYSSLETMQGYMEAIDVENDEYEAWDATGRLLQLRVGASKSQWLQMVAKDEIARKEDFADIRARAVPYREPEPLLKSLRRRMGWLKADD